MCARHMAEKRGQSQIFEKGGGGEAGGDLVDAGAACVDGNHQGTDLPRERRIDVSIGKLLLPDRMRRRVKE